MPYILTHDTWIDLLKKLNPASCIGLQYIVLRCKDLSHLLTKKLCNPAGVLPDVASATSVSILLLPQFAETVE